MAKQKGKKIENGILGKLPMSHLSVKAAGKAIQNWVTVEKLLPLADMKSQSERFNIL